MLCNNEQTKIYFFNSEITVTVSYLSGKEEERYNMTPESQVQDLVTKSQNLVDPKIDDIWETLGGWKVLIDGEPIEFDTVLQNNTTYTFAKLCG